MELALQAAMLVTRRHGLLSLEEAYHGNSIGTLSIGSSDLRDRANAGLPRCHKIAGPFDARAAERAEALLKKRDIAAFVMEPVICNLGGIVPDACLRASTSISSRTSSASARPLPQVMPQWARR